MFNSINIRRFPLLYTAATSRSVLVSARNAAHRSGPPSKMQIRSDAKDFLNDHSYDQIFLAAVCIYV